MLEAAYAGKRERPSLIVLARDIYPPTMLSHVPVLAQKLNVKLLILPGQASTELGQAFGTKKTSILVFLPPADKDHNDDGDDDDSREQNAAITSFVNFMIQQIPNDSIGNSSQS